VSSTELKSGNKTLNFIVWGKQNTDIELDPQRKKPLAKAIPHRKFWGSLPGLVADGCKFTARKVLSPCGVTVGNSEETETILP